MHKYRMMGPSGPMETLAVSMAKAKQNFRYRLVREHGLSWFAAREYDYSDLKVVD